MRSPETSTRLLTTRDRPANLLCDPTLLLGPKRERMAGRDQHEARQHTHAQWPSGAGSVAVRQGPEAP